MKCYIDHTYETEFWEDVRPIAEQRLVSVRGSQKIEFGGSTIECFDTPGHSHDHLCFHDYSTKTVFTGDALGARYHEVSPVHVMYATTGELDIVRSSGSKHLEMLIGWSYTLRIRQRRASSLFRRAPADRREKQEATVHRGEDVGAGIRSESLVLRAFRVDGDEKVASATRKHEAESLRAQFLFQRDHHRAEAVIENPG
jgi:hypothetical protein